jgi:hypothetical protein
VWRIREYERGAHASGRLEGASWTACSHHLELSSPSDDDTKQHRRGRRPCQGETGGRCTRRKCRPPATSQADRRCPWPHTRTQMTPVARLARPPPAELRPAQLMQSINLRAACGRPPLAKIDSGCGTTKTSADSGGPAACLHRARLAGRTDRSRNMIHLFATGSTSSFGPARKRPTPSGPDARFQWKARERNRPNSAKHNRSRKTEAVQDVGGNAGGPPTDSEKVMELYENSIYHLSIFAIRTRSSASNSAAGGRTSSSKWNESLCAGCALVRPALARLLGRPAIPP